MSDQVVHISRSDLEGFRSSQPASVSDVKHLASYNWIEGSTPTIAVPGLPPLWTPRKGSQKVQKDSGLIYIAQNAARHPDSPVEPLFRSLFETHPSFDLRSIDVVTDRNNVRKLLQFVHPGGNRHKLEAFTIHVEVTKSTVILARTETATTEIIGPGEFRGFGHEFEKKYTRSEIRGATGHHRVLSYRFCGMNFIIRHETDGYVKSTAATKEATDGQGLSDLLGNLSLAPKTHDSLTTFPGSKLRARKEGQEVALSSTLEIKTRSKMKPLAFNEVAPQLWVSQTPLLVTAYHYNRGTFFEPKVEDVVASLKRWEADNESNLAKLGGLIERVGSIAKDLGGKATIKYDAVKDKLVIQKNADSADMLPEDLYARWNEDGQDEKDGDVKDTKVDGGG